MVETPYIKPTLIDYPEADGEPMAESDATRNYLVYCVEALRLFFESRPQIYVSGNLFIYYEEGVPEKCLSPDVFVIFGVSKRERRSYKTWQEGGKLPSFALEITSLTTQKKDEEVKPDLYASLGVSEYFQYDPTGDYLNPPLKGRRLVEGHYEAIAAEVLADGTVSLHSQMLGLDLRLLPLGFQSISIFSGLAPVARELRLFDPQTGAMLLTYRELEQARLEAEQAAAEERRRAEQEAQRAEQEAQRAEQEAQRAEQAERQVAELLERLRSQGLEP